MSATVNLAEVLRVCVRSALAAQQYIALDLLKLSDLTCSGKGSHNASSILELGEEQKQQLLRSLNSSVAVDVKAELAYKEGEASHDLVTSADVLTQAVVVKALSTAFPDLPFTIVGEEESDATDKNLEIAAKTDYCLKTYYTLLGGTSAAMPCADAFDRHLSSQHTDSAAAGVLTADSVEALRQRVSIYIDPIDGTNCFVTGVWQSPMTLIGITVDATPLAAVVNRVFLYPIGHATDAAGEEHAQTSSGSISYVWNVSPSAAGSSFMVHEGQQVPLHSPKNGAASHKMGSQDVLQVTRSSTTKASFLAEVSARLQPSETVLARGAGNKVFTLIEKTFAESYGVEQHRHGQPVHADVFICPGHTIKKWDTCAPHAFLYALGGDIYNHHGAALRYPLKPGDDVRSGDFTDLPDGIVAVRKEAMEVVAHRMNWTGRSHC